VTIRRKVETAYMELELHPGAVLAMLMLVFAKRLAGMLT
jgi:hypothetical protein